MSKHNYTSNNKMESNNNKIPPGVRMNIYKFLDVEKLLKVSRMSKADRKNLASS